MVPCVAFILGSRQASAFASEELNVAIQIDHGGQGDVVIKFRYCVFSSIRQQGSAIEEE
jgi:hypothetical protein